MKYSFMSFSCPDLSLDDMLATAERFGYDGVEPRVAENHKHGVELEATPRERELIRAKVDESRIKFSCLATSCSYADPATAAQNTKETRLYIDLAADTGSPSIRVFGGVIPEDVTREAAIDLVSKSLGSVADQAGKRGVAVCLETHDDWCDPANMAAVMKKVNHPAVRVNWDIMHPVLKENKTVEESFQVLKSWIGHVHFHDGVSIFKDDNNYNLQFCPVGQGNVDHRRAVELLGSISWPGWLSGEWINWEPYQTHLPRELAAMKGYEKGLTPG